MNALSNFIGAMRELDRLTSSWEYYDVLGIPPILRLLLLDQLVDQVNQEFRRKIVFEVGSSHIVPDNPTGQEPVLFLSSVSDSFDPYHLEREKVPQSATSAWPKPRPVSRKEFLALCPLVVNGRYITVHQLIEHLAYVHGRLHPGTPKSPEDAQLLEVRRLIQVGDLPVGARAMRSIGRVVFRALVPLRDDVMRKYGRDS